MIHGPLKAKAADTFYPNRNLLQGTKGDAYAAGCSKNRSA